ncbi:MAG: insulinase family protein [Cyanobacteria bacterium]|nr:insulinase family protein [Cyanobacteria bacterium CG_2015-16_32_12]NCO76758.1 insulinase family protein [Cyanobacteria bacterium CG_2015-22_32_23]NCQ05870.1 insulinase family protein [Cyanobacteria bacterium CG_2015-09_32_10]NCS84869.1 insulinase family protein [Cyanobacteria bacterium CG_2015-02_32_10]
MKQNQQHIQKNTLNNGITLIVTENPTTEIIAGKIFLRHAGSLWESTHQAGVFHLLASVMSKGTNKLSSLEIAEKVESMGALLSIDTSSDYFLVSMKTITDDFTEIFNLAAEILRFPSFPEKEIELEKKITLQNLLSQKEQPFNIAFSQLREMIYGQHPYSFSTLGTEKTIQDLTIADLKYYHEKHFRPDNLVISLAGKIDLHQAISMVEKTFGHWKTSSIPTTEINPYPLYAQSSYKKIEQSNQQTIIMMGYLVPEMKHPDYATLKLLTTYLGNGLSSRLFVELREKRGLAYDVSSFYPTRLDKSQFVVYMGTSPDNTEIGKEGLYNEVKRLREEKLSLEELKTTKNKILGQYALGKQTNGEFAQIFGWYETLGLGIEYDTIFPQQITNVTLEDIQRVANDYFQDDFLCTSIVGN